MLETLEDDFNSQQETIRNFIDRNDSEALISYIKRFTNDDLISFTFGNTQKTILHKLAFMDMPGLFNPVFLSIKEKLEGYQLQQLINIQDEEGNTAIHYVAFKGNLDVLLLLISNGGDVFLRNNSGLSVMHMAAQGDRPNLLIYFKDKFNMSIVDQDNSGNTPLHWACHSFAENVVNFLLCWMDDINIIDKHGQTPLHIAIHNFRPRMIKKLLFKGADVNLKDNKGQSVLSIVRENQDNPEFDHLFRIITDFKPMKLCLFQSNASAIQQEKSFFNSYLFILLHVITEAITYFVLLKEVNRLVLDVLFYGMIVLLIASFCFVHWYDPGIMHPTDDLTWVEMVERKYMINDFCPWCRVCKLRTTKHCHSCRHCIEDFDHHCNWIDNCVGKANSGIFMIFVLIVLLNLILSYYIALAAFLIKDVGSIEINGWFGFAFIFLHTPKDVFAIFVMSICILFFVPVFYVMWLQIKGRCSRKKLIKKEML